MKANVQNKNLAIEINLRELDIIVISIMASEMDLGRAVREGRKGKHTVTYRKVGSWLTELSYGEAQHIRNST